MKEETNSIIQWFVFIALITVTIIRGISDVCHHIPYINLFALFVVLTSLFSKVCIEKKADKRLKSFRGFVYLFVALPIAIVTGLIVCGILTITTTWSDIFSLLALIISVPSDIIFRGITKVFFSSNV
jgi:hypothetical protein